MLSRTHRFHGYGSLGHAYRHGQTVRVQSLAIRYHLNARRSNYRVAVVISKKVEKSAVRRNRLRRRIYAAIRQKATAIKKPYDIVITVFDDSVNTMSPAELENLVSSLLSKAAILS